MIEDCGYYIDDLSFNNVPVELVEGYNGALKPTFMKFMEIEIKEFERLGINPRLVGKMGAAIVAGLVHNAKFLKCYVDFYFPVCEKFMGVDTVHMMCAGSVTSPRVWQEIALCVVLCKRYGCNKIKVWDKIVVHYPGEMNDKIRELESVGEHFDEEMAKHYGKFRAEHDEPIELERFEMIVDLIQQEVYGSDSDIKVEHQFKYIDLEEGDIDFSQKEIIYMANCDIFNPRTIRIPHFTQFEKVMETQRVKSVMWVSANERQVLDIGEGSEELMNNILSEFASVNRYEHVGTPEIPNKPYGMLDILGEFLHVYNQKTEMHQESWTSTEKY